MGGSLESLEVKQCWVLGLGVVGRASPQNLDPETMTMIHSCFYDLKYPNPWKLWEVGTTRSCKILSINHMTLVGFFGRAGRAASGSEKDLIRNGDRCCSCYPKPTTVLTSTGSCYKVMERAGRYQATFRRFLGVLGMTRLTLNPKA